MCRPTISLSSPALPTPTGYQSLVPLRVWVRPPQHRRHLSRPVHGAERGYEVVTDAATGRELSLTGCFSEDVGDGSSAAVATAELGLGQGEAGLVGVGAGGEEGGVEDWEGEGAGSEGLEDGAEEVGLAGDGVVGEEGEGVGGSVGRDVGEAIGEAGEAAGLNVGEVREAGEAPARPWPPRTWTARPPAERPASARRPWRTPAVGEVGDVVELRP